MTNCISGCGKTTQCDYILAFSLFNHNFNEQEVPQFILDSFILSNRGSQVSIIVTQPRRISAISVAARVSQERLDDGSVGYAIRGESKQNENTKLLFCTTGVVLRRLSTGDNLEDVTHIVVDEVMVTSHFIECKCSDLLCIPGSRTILGWRFSSPRAKGTTEESSNTQSGSHVSYH
jgi:hypothetical protein